MSTTPVQLDTELLNLIACEDASLDRTISQHVILDRYRQGMISTGKGASLPGMDCLSLVRWAGERGVPHFRYPPKNLTKRSGCSSRSACRSEHPDHHRECRAANRIRFNRASRVAPATVWNGHHSPAARDEIEPTLAELPSWRIVANHSVDHILADLPPVLDLGERHAIALGLSTGINRLLIDDLAGRKIAQSLGLMVIGTFGAVALARNEGLIPEARPLLDALVQGGLFATLPLHRRTIEHAGEEFPEDPPAPIGRSFPNH